MSHFTVLCVLGPEVDPTSMAGVEEACASLLAPYDENTEMDGYPVYEDVTNTLLYLGEDAYTKPPLLEFGPPPKSPSRGLDPLTREEEQARWKAYQADSAAWLARVVGKLNRFQIVKLINKQGDGDEFGYDDQKGYYRMSHYNPESKWDWYTLGGRWRGFFIPKPGHSGVLGEAGVFGNEAKPGHVDCLRVKDIDFEAMSRAAIQEREAQLAEFDAEPDENKKWVHLPWGINPDEDPNWRTDFLGKPVHLATFAWVDEDGWKAKGEMGWFGMSKDTQSDEEWAKEWYNAILKLDPETTVAVVDCHI